MFRSKNKKGFTLMEILIVMGIGILLMSISIFSISTARQKSRDGKRISDINQIRLALEQFYDACGSYPNQLVSSANNGCTLSTTFGKFLGQIPTDPKTGVGYYYYAIGSGADCYNYHIAATLENASHAELSNDNDIIVSPGAACIGGGSFVSGADGSVYDFIPNR